MSGTWVDVGHVGANTVNRRLIPAGAIAPIKPYLVLDEVTNTANWYGNRHWFTDPAQKYVFAHSADFKQTFVFFINTNLVKSADLKTLKSPDDLLKGKWKKKVVALSPMMGQSGNSYFRYSITSKPYGLKWMKKFIQSRSVEFVSSSRLIETGIARGKYAFAVFPHARPLDKMQKQGLPVKRVEHSFPGAPGIMTAGAPTQTVQVYDRAPHPNAAKLFVNWLLSKEGLTFVHDNVREAPNPRNSLRKDVPKTNVDPGSMPKPGVKYFGADLIPKYQAQRFKIMKTLQGWYKETYNK
jgi:iron(III) transport system substrate-binding protein